MYENFATPEILNNNSVLWDPFHPQIELKKTEPPQRYAQETSLVVDNDVFFAVCLAAPGPAHGWGRGVQD